MKNLVIFDCEVYPNYFLVAFKNIKSGKTLSIDVCGESNRLSKQDVEKLKRIIAARTLVGFNSRNYDIPIVFWAITGKSCGDIYKLSEKIIGDNMPGWMTIKRFDIPLSPKLSHIDISEPSPGVRVSLKLYGARLNSKRLQDLPTEPGSLLSEKEIEQIRLYCINDLNTTIDLYKAIEDRINLRGDMGKEYGQDLYSKSDAQIAEFVIKSQLQKMYPSRKFCKQNLPKGFKFKYQAPDYIKFKTDVMIGVFDFILNHYFELNDKGSVKLPKELTKKIIIGDTEYKMGIGGLHSNEKKQVLIPENNELLIDRDVVSYYPSIILNLGLFPKHLGSGFLNVYDDIVKKRLKAKADKNKVINESLKIVINGSFGKLGSKYSLLYAPDLMLTVTLTGQLCLLMLIEELELNGIKIVSANTDGFVVNIDKNQYDKYDDICFNWELETGFTLEETRYKALYSRDVNNYLAVTDNYNKGKGIFALGGLSKSPQNPVVIESVIAYLTKGVPIETYIKNTTDVSKFLTCRSVTGGAVWRDEYLGKVVRWIYSTNGDTITYKKNGNKVAKSDGASPLMDLPSSVPDDVDYDKYFSEAHDILDSIGLEL